MKKRLISDDQIALTLRQAENAAVWTVCRKMGVLYQVFYRRKKTHSCTGVAEICRLK